MPTKMCLALCFIVWWQVYTSADE